MLKTALQLRWIAALLFALAISTVFVLLSQWQFSTAESDLPPSTDRTEEVRPLTEVFTPGEEMFGTTADQMVSLTGSFRTEDTVLIDSRLYDGDEGYWVVTAFAVDGAPGDAVIPVVRGWVADPGEAAPAPSGEAAVVGRLLPPEAPVAQPLEDGVLPSLSSAELINIWDTPGYSGFVTADEITVGGEAPDAGNMQVVNVGAQPQETTVNWMNIFYALEWVVFAGFSVFLWWRLVADAHRRSLEDDEYEDDEYYDDEDDDDNDGGGLPAGRPAPSSEVPK